MALLEIAVTSVEDALRAEEGGADSIEVSRELNVGGLTPEMDLVREIRSYVKLKMHVLVRPHAKGFYLNLGEVLEMAKSIRAALECGADGIVCAGVNRRGQIDVGMARDFVHECKGKPLTVHRAIDFSLEPEKTLKKLPGAGVRRVLTAGPALNAWEGREGLAAWVKRFGDEISFVASGGLKLEQVPAMLRDVKAQEYHFGSAAQTDGVVDVGKVRELRRALA